MSPVLLAHVKELPDESLSAEPHSCQAGMTACMQVDVTPAHHWYIDSGASAHICRQKSQFQEYAPQTDHGYVVLRDDTHLPILGEGTVIVSLGQNDKLHLKNTLHVPDISKNLILVCKLAAQPGISLSFEKQTYEIKENS